MDKNSLSWNVADGLSFHSSVISLDDVSLDISGVVDFIKRPSEGSLLSGDLLLHGSEETLGVEESSHPEGDWSILADPVVELEVSVDETLHPCGEGWSQPGDLSSSWIVLPLSWHLEVVNTINSRQVLGS